LQKETTRGPTAH
jgi:hypothetical protein